MPQPLLDVVSRNLGRRSVQLFVDFYQGDSYEQQLQGAEDLLADIIGRKKAKEQLALVKQKGSQ